MSIHETVEFWMNKSVIELVNAVCSLHKEHRTLLESQALKEVTTFRRAISSIFLQGSGIEVGAGNRPWPVSNVECFYGDIRDGDKLKTYFKDDRSKFDGKIDAQTFEGIEDNIMDFVISAHVIEHLQDPIGAISSTMRVLKSGGVFITAVPDMRHTFDIDRPPTTLEHLLRDEIDGGAGTKFQAYEEHARYVHPRFLPPIPESQIEQEITKIMRANMDIHFHAWDSTTFMQLLMAINSRLGFGVEANVSVQNENIYVMRKL